MYVEKKMEKLMLENRHLQFWRKRVLKNLANNMFENVHFMFQKNMAEMMLENIHFIFWRKCMLIPR